jgi:hypothetical protein
MRIRDFYIDVVTSQNRRPSSLDAFAATLETKHEDEFLDNYTSFKQLESDIFRQIFEELRDSLLQDEVYQSYNAREKLLAIFFTWFEQLSPQRDFWKIIEREEDFFSCQSYIEQTKAPFEELMTLVIEEGKQQEIIAQRPFEGWYKKGLWWDVKYLISFWLKDDSENLEMTDAAIEKAVNFSFDVMEPNLLDSGFDFIKFAFQNR